MSTAQRGIRTKDMRSVIPDFDESDIFADGDLGDVQNQPQDARRYETRDADEDDWKQDVFDRARGAYQTSVRADEQEQQEDSKGVKIVDMPETQAFRFGDAFEDADADRDWFEDGEGELATDGYEGEISAGDDEQAVPEEGELETFFSDRLDESEEQQEEPAYVRSPLAETKYESQSRDEDRSDEGSDDDLDDVQEDAPAPAHMPIDMAHGFFSPVTNEDGSYLDDIDEDDASLVGDAEEDADDELGYEPDPGVSTNPDDYDDDSMYYGSHSGRSDDGEDEVSDNEDTEAETGNGDEIRELNLFGDGDEEKEDEAGADETEDAADAGSEGTPGEPEKKRSPGVITFQSDDIWEQMIRELGDPTRDHKSYGG